MATLGSELKQLREAKGLTLTDLAETTRIGIRFLQAIESDDYKSLPGGLFNRSFIKAYARAVGLDEDNALLAYQRQTGATAPLSDAPLNTVPAYTVSRSSNLNDVNLVPSATVLVILAVLGVGAWAIYSYLHRLPPAPAPAPVINTTAPQTTAPVDPNATPPILNGGVKPPEPPPTQPGQPPPPASTAPIMLELTATNPCYVKADPDGKLQAGGIIKAGETKQIEAQEKLMLRVGKVDAVTVKLNGKDITLPSTDKIKSDVLISLKDGVPVIEQIKRKIPVNKPAAPDGAGTTTTPTPGTGNPQ